MAYTTVLTFIALLSTTGWAQYTLEDDYTSGGDFFDKFTFWDQADPTNGCVDYVDHGSAQQANLTKISNGQVYIGVDHDTKSPSNGRESVRLTSTKSYNSGLVILDLEHMPSSACGSWPAFWMVGPDWPSNGEIDIIEGVNDQTANDMTLHTGPGCSISKDTSMLGQISTSNCDVNAEGQDKNAGCQVTTTNTQTYGDGFNANGGGVYATEWTSSAINIYFFPRSSIPSDVAGGAPNPSGWGKPMASFKGDCDISSTFKDLQIVFDITFCGDWAGNTWSSSSCSSKASTCDAFVADHPEAFEESYWTVNSLKVYQSNGGYESSSSVSAYSTPSAHSLSSVVSASASMPYAANSSSVMPVYPTQVSKTAPVNSVSAISAPAPPASSATGWNPHWHHWTKPGHPVPRAEPTANPAVAALPSSLPEGAPSDKASDMPTPDHGSLHATHETQSIEADARRHGRVASHKSVQRMARHLRQHKRHGGGRL